MWFWSWHICLPSPSTRWTFVVFLAGTGPWGLSLWRAWSLPWQGSRNTPRVPGSFALMMTVPALQVSHCKEDTLSPLLASSSTNCKDRSESVGFAHTKCLWQVSFTDLKLDSLLISFPWMATLGFHYIRVHAPGATESATVRNNFTCMICSSPLKEDVKFRVLGGESDASECHWNGDIWIGTQG